MGLFASLPLWRFLGLGYASASAVCCCCLYPFSPLIFHGNGREQERDEWASEGCIFVGCFQLQSLAFCADQFCCCLLPFVAARFTRVKQGFN